MEWIQSAAEWFRGREALWWWLFAASVAMFVLTPVAIGWIVISMPADYFAERRRRRDSPGWQRHPVLRPLVFVVKNLVGAALILAGIVMLVVPGQGALTIAVGLMLVDFPGKLSVLRSLATRKSAWRSLNWLRKKAGREPLKEPESRKQHAFD
jgi:hypothetical protein